MGRFWFVSISLGFLLLGLTMACQKDNNPPYITAFTATPDSIFPGDTVAINFTLWDDENDELFCQITCEIGELFPYDLDSKPISPVKWIAPNQTGEFWFYLDFNDGKHFFKDSLSVIIKDTTGTFLDSRDGQEYRWVKIAQQFWMARNLAYIPNIEEFPSFTAINPFYMVYDYDGKIPEEARYSWCFAHYGVLYNQSATNDSLCPDGWSLPRKDQWETLFAFLGDNVGEKLRSVSYWGPENESINIARSGFNALPAGSWQYVQSSGGAFGVIPSGGGQETRIWFEKGTDLIIHKYTSELGLEAAPGYSGHSVRCIKD